MFIGCEKCQTDFQFETDGEEWQDGQPNQHNVACPNCKTIIIVKTYKPQEE